MLITPDRLCPALNAVAVIAAGQGRFVSQTEMTTVLGVKPRCLEAMLFQLQRAGVIVGKRGPKGGYALPRPAAKMTAADVATVIMGGPEPLRGISAALLADMETSAWEHLAKITLEELAEGVEGLNVTKAAA